MDEIIELLNLSNVYFIITDFNWNILEISKEFLKKLNYSSKDIEKLKITDLITEEYKEAITMFLLNYKGELMKHNINWNFYTKNNYINSCQVTSMKYNENVIFLLTEENTHNKITNASLNMLTGEKSINFFIEEIEKDLYINKEINFSILSVNIENFNRIIEKYGFEKKSYIIDLFLKKIRKIIPVDNVIAMTETNQLYIYLKRVNTKLVVLHYINSILEESKKIIFFGSRIEFILKIGVSMYPDNGSDIKELIDKSNLASTYPNTINYKTYLCRTLSFFLTVFGNVTNKKEEIMKRKLLTGILATTLLAGLATEASAGLFKKKAKTSNESQEIVVWEQMEPTGLEVFTEIVNDFMAQNPNIKVTVTHYPNEDLRTNFQNASLAGQGPDIVYGPNDNIGLFIVSDLIKPVDEVVSSDFLSTIEKNSLDAGKINGKYYQIPDMNGNQIALLYNKALVKEAPKTWDEFYEIAKKYQKVDELDPENSTYGFLYNEKEPYWFVGWYQGYGGRVMDENYNPTLNNEAMVKALQFAYDVRNKYGLGEAGMDYDMSSQLFKQGKAAFLLNGAWSWQEYVNAGIDLGIAPMTTLPNGGGNATFYSATKGFSISSSVEEDKYEAISKFFEFVLSPENNAKYAKAQSQAPAVLAARELPEIKNDALQRASIATIEKTTPMPIVAEMRAIWDAMRPTLEAVINGSLTPAEAAAKMQEDAEYGIRTIRGE